MQVSVNTVSALERRIEVAVPAERMIDEIETRLRQIARTARLKGFRPGKAPLSVVKQQFSAQIKSEVLSDLLRQSYAEAISQHQIRPASDPRIEVHASNDESGLRYTAQLEVMPDVPLPVLKDLIINRPVAEVTPDDVDRMLDSMRRQRATFEEQARPAIQGDRVTLDFDGTVDGTPFKGGSATGVTVLLGLGQLLSDFESGIDGMSAGESKVITVTFPADYPSQEVAGKVAEFSVRLIRVETPVLPEIDDTFCQFFGILEGGVQTLREEVIASMSAELDRAAKNRMQNEVRSKLAHSVQFELPRGLIAERAGQIQRQVAGRMGRSDPASMPSSSDLEAAAREQISVELLMSELVRAHDITLNRDLLTARLDSIVQGYPNAEELRRQYLQNPDFMRGLERTVLDEQLIEFVVSKATVVDVPATFSEITGFGQGAAA